MNKFILLKKKNGNQEHVIVPVDSIVSIVHEEGSEEDAAVYFKPNSDIRGTLTDQCSDTFWRLAITNYSEVSQKLLSE